MQAYYLLLLFCFLNVSYSVTNRNVKSRRQVGDPNAKTVGETFLLEISQRPNIYKLKSGLLIEIIVSSDKSDAKSPTLDDLCDVNYTGTFMDGKLFDQSQTDFAPIDVIKGWTEAMQYMVEGDKWKLYIPYYLAYGESGHRGIIPPYAPLVFELELLEVLEGGKTLSEAKAMFKEALVEADTSEDL